jgi:hypothetical protein
MDKPSIRFEGDEMNVDFDYFTKYPTLITVNIEDDQDLFADIVQELFLLGKDYRDYQKIIEISLRNGLMFYLDELQEFRRDIAPF